MVRLPPRLRSRFPELKKAYTAGTRAVAPATRLVSKVSGGWLPTGVALTMEDAAARSGGTCVTARPLELVSRPAALGHPAGHPAYAPVVGQEIPRVAVAELPRGRVLGDKSAVITGSNELVHEISLYFGTTRPLEHPLFLQPFPGPPTEVAGRLGVLASRGDTNYYHFMVDVLPRLGVLAMTDVAPPDRWYVPTSMSFQRELLALAGLPAEQLLDRDTHPHVRAEVLVVPGLPATHVLNPAWVTGWLRERILPNALAGGDGTPGPERIYITRGAAVNNRRVVDEDKVVARLEQRGFVSVDPSKYSVAEQIRIFAGARRIVSAHGAGLTNFIFSPPRSGVVELMPNAPVLQDCYWTLSRTVPGLSYRYLVGEPGTGSDRVDLNAGLVSDITIDGDALERLLDDLDAELAD